MKPETQYCQLPNIVPKRHPKLEIVVVGGIQCTWFLTGNSNSILANTRLGPKGKRSNLILQGPYYIKPLMGKENRL